MTKILPELDKETGSIKQRVASNLELPNEKWIRQSGPFNLTFLFSHMCCQKTVTFFSVFFTHNSPAQVKYSHSGFCSMMQPRKQLTAVKPIESLQPAVVAHGLTIRKFQREPSLTMSPMFWSVFLVPGSQVLMFITVNGVEILIAGYGKISLSQKSR